MIINNGYFLHSENILLAMITDSSADVRKEGYSRILSIRNEHLRNGRDHDAVRTFKKPVKNEHNFNSTAYYNILKPDRFIHEPPYTQTINRREIEALATLNENECSRFQVPYAGHRETGWDDE